MLFNPFFAALFDASIERFTESNLSGSRIFGKACQCCSKVQS